ncbi:MAG: epoxyqueuosine reductase QueH [Candidatus Margulisbacteria bacterium]|nr:epoxyqueuosine reductase QueH [Candidatus Margulisiibacteriota bacterium]
MRKLLLHTCCGPCTTYVHKSLVDQGFEVKGLFYNPNIRPREEYEKRLLMMEYYATAVGLKVIYQPNDLELEPGNCENCYRVRLRRTAQFARDLAYDCFSTTLLISPFQKHELLRQIGEEIGKESGIPFYYQDFRIGYRESRQMAKKFNLYMQKYCGCDPHPLTLNRPPSPSKMERGIKGVRKKEASYAKVS